jgi:hypothetical protein
MYAISKNFIVYKHFPLLAIIDYLKVELLTRRGELGRGYLLIDI